MSPDGLSQLHGMRETSRQKRTPPPPRHPKTDIPARENADQAPLPDATITARGKGDETGAVSARVNDSARASEPDGATVSKPAREKDVTSAGTRARGKVGNVASEKPSRRRGRPPGPERRRLNTRILADLDDRLTLEATRTRSGVQDVVERALDEYLTRQERRRAREAKGAPTPS